MARSSKCRLTLSPLSCVLILCLPGILRGAEQPTIPSPPVLAPTPGSESAASPKTEAPTKQAPAAPPAAKAEGRPPSPPSVEPSPRPSAVAYSSPILRLASVPNMLGDSFAPTGMLEVEANLPYRTAIPLGGASRRVKIADNNKALPMNRCYFTYQHFNNALETTAAPGTPSFASVDRYTIGLEKTFFDDRWSVDVRMPFAGGFQTDVPAYAVDGGDIGNLAVLLKRILVAGPCGSVAVGMGIDMPTGSDLHGRIGTSDLLIENNAVFLSPYVGFLWVPNQRLFYQGFLQVDVATNGDRLRITENGQQGVTTSPQRITEQSLMYVDLSAGYWLYRDQCARRVTGLASIAEVHYTGTLNDANVLEGTANTTEYRLGDLMGEVDFVDLTVGLHAELPRCTNLRVAGVFPLENGPQKPFDAELQISINRRF